MATDFFRGDSIERRPLPPLKRIQILILSVEATEALFPLIAKNRSKLEDNVPEPEPIIRHLSKLLQDSSDRCAVIRQFQTFTVGCRIYVVVDMEAAGKGRTSRGILTFSTSIITAGLPLDVLTSLHVCLVRPSSKEFSTRSSRDVSEGSRRIQLSSPSRSFSRRLFNRRQESLKISTNLTKNSPGVITMPVIIELISILKWYLLMHPCLVFSPGQQIQLPLLPELEVLQPFRTEKKSKGLLFFVYSTSSNTPGVVVPGVTDVTIELDPIGEFDQIDVSPLADTVPESYQFDFFNDYIRPFVEANPFRLLCQGTLFSFHGVQFKVQCTTPSKKEEINPPEAGEIFWKPFRGVLPLLSSIVPATKNVIQISDAEPGTKEQWDAENERFLSRTIVRRGHVCRRIGRTTHIYRSEPQLRDILPPSVIDEVLRLPTRLQSIAAIHAIADLAPQDLIRIFGLNMNDLEPGQQELRKRVAAKVLGEFATVYKKDISSSSEDGICVVCLSSVSQGDQILELPCSHIFHLNCVEEWLKRSIVCPVCKRDLRDFLNETAS